MKNATKLRSFLNPNQNRPRRLFAAALMIALMFALIPPRRTQAVQAEPISKLSVALQLALNSNVSSVWLDPSRQRVRTLIQTYGAVPSSLSTAIAQAGGSVVRQFSSINGLLADLPKNKLLAIAARSEVERMSADHLAQKSSSHLEAATGADRVRASGNLEGDGIEI